MKKMIFSLLKQLTISSFKSLLIFAKEVVRLLIIQTLETIRVSLAARQINSIIIFLTNVHCTY